MVDATGDVALSSTVKSSLYNNVQALLRETDSGSASQTGMLRWNLQKKMETHPSCSVLLIKVLLKELEKMLHRSGDMIPNKLHRRASECLMKLLIFPLPYAAVTLSILQSIKMEITTPASLYQRRVIAEQNLKSKHFAMQEKVFVLADPAVFSAPLEATVRAELEASGLLRDTLTQEKNLVFRALQTALETASQSSRLAKALGAMEDHMVEKYFQEVVLAVEQSIKHGAGGRADYLNRLQDIYRDILTASNEELTKVDCSSVCNTAMPFPEINFLLWNNEEDLWNLLTNFTLGACITLSVDEEEKDKRDSVQSEDSGIERDLKESDFDDTEQPTDRNSFPVFTRRNAIKSTKPPDQLSLMREKIEAFPGSSPMLKEERRHTARVVVMGDDRVLGRLTWAYHSIRERESKRLLLTKRLNLQLYYIPVADMKPPLSSPDEGRLSVASLLGKVDPWYNSNINSLGAAIPTLAKMDSNHSKSLKRNLFLLDTLCYYLRCGFQPVNLPLYSVKMTCSSSVVEEVFASHLEADIPEFRHLKERKSAVGVFGAVISISYTKISLSKRKVVKGEAHTTCGMVMKSELAAVTSGEDYLAVSFYSVDSKSNTIQTQKISIKTMEQTLSVCLDKDSRRTYTDVQRIEISPCLDPGCSIQSSNEEEPPLIKYLDKVLSLPINTFTEASTPVGGAVVMETALQV
ncbi:phosphoinositide 3-kinase regulatory subunit 6 [Scomber japonicus]|uniref:phosphoinositide 3-kinase regulatory subunit 6 n=1 Tax=Scomber japonicus TaxID=13676 RepID=UPI0023057219|nr:phosphoinositide 3-kinase regulatory subunit 6 [Scomber japonicus]